jgi:Family of unknown function (DUF5808)
MRRAVRLIALGLMVAAVARELSQPPRRRRWEGRLLGIPYSFRPPTLARIRRAYWNPADPRLFTERVLGVGWSINLARARPLMERGFRRLAGTATPRPSVQAQPLPHEVERPAVGPGPVAVAGDPVALVVEDHQL